MKTRYSGRGNIFYKTNKQLWVKLNDLLEEPAFDTAILTKEGIKTGIKLLF